MADIDLQVRVGTQPKDPFAGVNKSLDSTDDKIKSVEGGFASFGAAAVGAAAVVGSLGLAFNFVVGATREMEDLQTQFVAFTGSAEGAADQLSRLTEFASKSPFSLAEVAQADKTLLAFGSTTKDSLEQLRQLGEVSAATGKDLSDLATIFGQIQAEGKLTGERFNQLIERGVNIGPELAKSLGVAGTAIRGLISDSKISADQVAAAFQKMTSEGGQFFGATDRQSKTLSGSLSSLTDNVSILAAEVGQRLTPALTGSTNVFSDLINKVTEYLKNEREIASDPTRKRIDQLNQQIEDSNKVLDNLNSIATSDGIAQLGKYLYGGAEGLEKYSRTVASATGKLVAERTKLQEALQQTEANKSIEENIKAVDAARSKANEKELAAAQEQKKKLQDIEDKAAQALADKIKDTQDQITKLEFEQGSARVEAQKLLSDQVVKSKIEAGDAEFVRNAEFNEAIRKANVDAAVAREAEISSAILQAKATQSELLLQFDQAEQLKRQDAQNKAKASVTKAEAERLAVIRKAQNDEFNLFTQTENARKNFDEQTYAQRVATANEGLNALAALTRSKSREAFELGKAAAIAQALITIPTTAIKAYSSLAGIPLVGPALGAAAAAAAIIAGTEQIRNIQNTRIAFAKGGVVPGQGNKDTVKALLTPGEVVVPKQNFSDLQESIRGSVDSDIVQLLQAGNQISGKVLDVITFGAVGEKLTRIIDVLNEIEANTVSIGSSGGNQTLPDIITDVIDERNKNRAKPRDNVGEKGQKKNPKRFDD